MQFMIRRLSSSPELDACATMMASSSPWDVLYFTVAQCRTELDRAEIQVDGAVAADGELLGFLASTPCGIGFEPLIEYLCVNPKCRSKGIGSRLITHFEDKLFPEADNLYLFVSDINPHAIRLYVRLGYLQVGALPNFNLEMQTEFLHRKTRRPRQSAARSIQLHKSADL
jgi:ribosomal protein S18 acetylase RimI-like enzyme